MRWWDDEKFKDGRIMDVGTPLEVYNNPSNMFVAGLIGSPAMNFFLAALKLTDPVFSLPTVK